MILRRQHNIPTSLKGSTESDHEEQGNTICLRVTLCFVSTYQMHLNIRSRSIAEVNTHHSGSVSGIIVKIFRSYSGWNGDAFGEDPDQKRQQALHCINSHGVLLGGFFAAPISFNEMINYYINILDHPVIHPLLSFLLVQLSSAKYLKLNN